MEVEFTARQVKISKALRTHAEEGMERIGRILGKSAHASITFSAQRHVQIVELTVQGRAQKIAATGKATTLDAALREAMEHAENQARRFRDRRMGSKRLAQGREGIDGSSRIAAQGAGKPAAGRGRDRPSRQTARVHRGSFLSGAQPRWLSRTF